MHRKLLVVLACLTLGGAGCTKPGTQSPTTPSPTGIQALNGSWTSVSAVTTAQNTCTNFKWTVSTLTATSGSGTFTATCQGNLAVGGSATGTLSGSTISWAATATGSLPGSPSCAISLTGTAILEPDQIRIPYSGTTCQGAVTGTEILRK